VLFACVDYVEQVRSGEIKGEQARLEGKGIEQMVKALELATGTAVRGQKTEALLPEQNLNAEQN
jgi:hypothetical protein